ncbi:MAG: peptidyl-prolyl cis-trans isomerase [Bacillus sp. (in: firmicutes)]
MITLFIAFIPFSGKFGEAEVAVVGDVSIDRQTLRDELEERYGNIVLNAMVDEEVIDQTAEKYGISVSDKELETELTFIKTLYGAYDQQYLQYHDDWEEQIRSDILLEKLLVADVEIDEANVKKVYDSNPEKYRTPTAYHLSHIVVDTKKKANQIHKELKEGASFESLAIEQSTDSTTSALDGDIGYITKDSKRYPKAYIEKAAGLKKGAFSKPIKLDDGYALIYLHEKVKSKNFTYEEVKSMIERQLAVEEIGSAVTADYFWEEIDVEWNYDAKE